MDHSKISSSVRPDDAWLALGEINHSIRFADAKASVLLAVGGVVGGIGLSQPLTTTGHVTTVQGACWSIALVAVALSSVLSLRALLPRLRVGGRRSESLLYFDHVARRFGRREEAFVAAFAQVAEDPQAMRREVTGQIWANSLVAHRKFRDVVLATWLLGTGLVSCGVALYLERL
jgi:hypothetical protein